MLAQQVIILTMSGSIQQLSTTGIFTRNFVIQNDAASAADMYIGHTPSTNVLPTTLDATTALYILSPGMSVEINESPRSQTKGEEYILSHWVVKGTASDKCRVTYVTRRTAATPT